MSLKKSPVFPDRNRENGFTFIEVLVSVTILSILGFAIWIGFISVINLIQTVPEATEKGQNLLNLDTYLRHSCEEILVPFWMPEYEYEEESDRVVLPYYGGKEENILSIEYKDKYITITPSIIEEDETEDESEPLPPSFKAGPYDEVRFEVISTKEEGLIGLEVSILETFEEYEGVKIFARFGSYPFWKEE
jgi:prepilin-type N-terminal cleavage/methylation domain-containing protein